MRHNIDQFLQKIKNKQQVDMNWYKDPAFCRELQSNALVRIKVLLYKILENRVQQKTALRSVLNMQDHYGFSILDYCLLAGLQDEALLIIALGGEFNDRLDPFWKQLSEQLDFEALPPLLEKLITTLEKIEIDAVNFETVARQESLLAKVRKIFNSTFNCTLKFIRNHKTASMLLLLGMICIIVAPLTLGASTIPGTILLSAVAVPAIYTAISEIHRAQLIRKSHEEIRTQTAFDEEIWMLRKLLDDVVQHENKLEATSTIRAEMETESRVAAERSNDQSLHEMLFHLRSFTRRHPIEHKQQMRAWRLMKILSL